MIFAETVLETATVVSVNDAVFAPAGISTEVGTVASALLLVIKTETPPAGATVPRVIVPFEVFPPTNEAGLSESEDTTGGLIVKVVEASTVPPDFATIFATTWAATDTVFTGNVTDVLPAGIVIVAGNVTAAWSLDKPMTMPTFGAGPSSVAVPVHEAVPTRVDGLTFRLDKTGGLTIKDAEDVAPARVADMDTVTTDATAEVLMANVALVLPAATGTVAGTVAPGLLLANLIVRPPVGAAPVNVMVPVEG